VMGFSRRASPRRSWKRRSVSFHSPKPCRSAYCLSVSFHPPKPCRSAYCLLPPSICSTAHRLQFSFPLKLPGSKNIWYLCAGVSDKLIGSLDTWLGMIRQARGRLHEIKAGVQVWHLPSRCLSPPTFFRLHELKASVQVIVASSLTSSHAK